jgi:hypothetical protein
LRVLRRVLDVAHRDGSNPKEQAMRSERRAVTEPVEDPRRPLARAVLVLAMVAAMLAMAGPASAGWENGSADPEGPIDRFTTDGGIAWIDSEDALVALAGPPLELGCFGLGFEDLEGQTQVVSLPVGELILLSKDVDIPVRVYAGTSIGALCEQVYAGETVEPLASGIARALATDNDLTVELSRASTYSVRANGRLVGPDGHACTFTAVFRAQVDRDGGFRLLREDIGLTC